MYGSDPFVPRCTAAVAVALRYRGLLWACAGQAAASHHHMMEPVKGVPSWWSACLPSPRLTVTNAETRTETGSQRQDRRAKTGTARAVNGSCTQREKLPERPQSGSVCLCIGKGDRPCATWRPACLPAFVRYSPARIPDAMIFNHFRRWPDELRRELTMLRGGVVRRRIYRTFEQLGIFCDLWATVADYSGPRTGVGLNVSRREGPLVVPQTLEKASIEN